MKNNQDVHEILLLFLIEQKLVQALWWCFLFGFCLNVLELSTVQIILSIGKGFRNSPLNVCLIKEILRQDFYLTVYQIQMN